MRLHGVTYMTTQDRIEQAARECVDDWYVQTPICCAQHEINALAESVIALIRREREDAARVERDECARLLGAMHVRAKDDSASSALYDAEQAV